MNYRSISLWLFSLLVITSIGCDGGGKKSREFLPNAMLLPHEILVVMDSSQWNGLLGDAIRDVFTEPLPGLPQAEAQFTVRYVSPYNLRGFHKRYPNLLFVFTLDNQSRSTKLLQSMFAEQALAQIKEDPQRFMLTRQDEFAKGQEAMYLFSDSEDQLINRIYSRKQQLLNYFQDIERDRNVKEFATTKSTQSLTNMLSEKWGFTMHFPAGYEVAKQDSNFVWVRLLDNQIDRSIWATWKPYRDQEIFKPEKLMEYRNSVVKNYVWGSDESTYMRLENQIPVVTEEVNFKGRFALETRGLWRLEKMIMGGPFISYAFVDEPTNRIYYIEGFTYAPGQDKRKVMSEMEAILWSFKTKGVQNQSTQ